MNTTPTHDSDCQHCGQPVTWSSRPADVRYGATVHADNNTACPK